MKGRVSPYDNDFTAKSLQVISKIKAKTEKFTLRELEAFQLRYGISNKALSELTGHSTAQISDFKSEKIPMPDRVKQHLQLIIQEFEAHL